MSEKFQNRYRIATSRLQNHDYTSNGAYFITICTANHEHWFGEVKDGELVLNDLGQLAKQILHETPQQFNYVFIDQYVIMPNHIHAILVINKKMENQNKKVELQPGEKPNGGITETRNPMLNEGLSHIVRWFKGRTTFEIRKTGATFKWQPRFHEHIIRTNKAYELINEYIITNPQRWSSSERI